MQSDDNKEQIRALLDKMLATLDNDPITTCITFDSLVDRIAYLRTGGGPVERARDVLNKALVDYQLAVMSHMAPGQRVRSLVDNSILGIRVGDKGTIINHEFDGELAFANVGFGPPNHAPIVIRVQIKDLESIEE